MRVQQYQTALQNQNKTRGPRWSYIINLSKQTCILSSEASSKLTAVRFLYKFYGEERHDIPIKWKINAVYGKQSRILCVKYLIQTNFLRFEGLIRSVRNFIKNCRIRHLAVKKANPIRPLILIYLYILKNQRGCRNIYDKFNCNYYRPTCLIKWQNELNLLQNLEWDKMFSLPFIITRDTNLRWFQVRINHRILGTNNLLFKMNIRVNDLCTFCLHEKETIKYLFWDCEITANFWNLLKEWLRNKCTEKF